MRGRVVDSRALSLCLASGDLRDLLSLEADDGGRKRFRSRRGPLLDKTLDRVTTYFVGYRPEITTVTLTEAVMTEYLLGTSCFSPHAELYPLLARGYLWLS
jgi:hypothetical protein